MTGRPVPAEKRRLTTEEKLWAIINAFIPHKGHDGIPGSPEGVLCIRCVAERHLDALVAALETARRQANQYEADLAQALVDADAFEQERDGAREELRENDRIVERAWRDRDAETERAVTAETALRALLDAIGHPEDVDQDCRFCTGHYGEHFDGCAWALARAAAPAETAETT